MFSYGRAIAQGLLELLSLGVLWLPPHSHCHRDLWEACSVLSTPLGHQGHTLGTLFHETEFNS